MDKIKAKKLFDELKGTTINDVCIEKLLDNGKSAAVFHGRKNNESFAIKIFDNEIIERHGVEIHEQRIERELSLKEHKIDNLVKIIDGGKIKIDDTDYLFIIMEYIIGNNIKNYIKNNDIDINFIVSTINILIYTTEELLKLTPPIVHRDIKPENIMVKENGDIVLMDLGVLKFVGAPSITDIDNKNFLGTLQYAPPEFLFRKETDNIECWRAINIYQIGAVLHDLIMKKELFAGIEPYGAMVVAVKEDMPSITSTKYNYELIQLARNMLHKEWHKRLELASIDSIKSILNKCLSPLDEPTGIYSNIMSEAAPVQAELMELENISRSKAEKIKITNETHQKIWNVINDYFIKKKELINLMDKIDSSREFTMENYRFSSLPKGSMKFYHIKGKFEFGFSRSFFILFLVENNASNYAKISLLGIIYEVFQRNIITEPEKLMHILFTKDGKYPDIKIRITNPSEIKIRPTCIFDGIVEFRDNSLYELIDTKVAVLIKNIIEYMKPEIQNEIEQRKKRLGNSSGSAYMRISSGPVMINI